MQKKIMSFFKKGLSISGLAILLGCSGDEQRLPPVTASENLNWLLQQAPISWIDLNQADVDTIIIPEDQIYEEGLFVDDSLYVANPFQIKAFENNLVTLDFASGNVVAIKRNGRPVQAIGRAGRGPGEFERPIAVMSDGSQLYIYDYGLQRITVFDHDYLLVDMFDFFGPVFFENKVKMNERYLIYQNSAASGLYASNPNAFLMNVHQLENLDSIYFEALPRIVPSGMQPGAYNNLWVSINSEDEILAAYTGLPYLFLYRDFQHNVTISLEAVHFDTTENPSLRPYPPNGNTGARVSSVLSHIHLMDDGDILISSFKLLHHLKPQPDDSYRHHRSYYLKREDTGEQIMTIRDITSFPDDPKRFYAVGWGFLFELILPK